MAFLVPLLILTAAIPHNGQAVKDRRAVAREEKRYLIAQEERPKQAPTPPAAPRRFLGRDGLKKEGHRPPLRNPRKSPTDSEAAAGKATAAGRVVPPRAPGSPRGQPAAADKPTQSGASSDSKAVGEEATGDIDFSKRAKKGKFNFEFSKAEIVDVVKAISNLMRRNFIIPEKLKSQRITILSPTQISAAEAYQVFLAALEVNGITVVRSGKFYKLVEAKDAIKSPIPTCVGPEDKCPRFSDLLITIILPLQHVEVSQINPVLKSLISKEGEITMFQPSNALIISEYAPNLNRIRRIIEALDVPGFEDELQLVQIQYASAEDIADKLSQIFEVQGRGGRSTAGKTPPRPSKARNRAAEAGKAEEGGDDVRISKIVPDERTNLLIIKANRRAFAAIRKLIDKLDVPASEDNEGLHVVYLQNADAEELSSTLSSLAQGQAQRQSRRPSAAKAAGKTGQPTSAILFEGEIKITADKSTNSLIIVASRHDFKALTLLIEKLDSPRRQVYVEAAILEVNVNDEDEFGVSWHTPLRFSKSDIGDELGGSGTIGFIQSAQAGGTSPTLVDLSDPAALLGVAGGSVVGVIGKPQTFKVGDSEISFPSFGVILKALQSASNTQVLSTPHILTTDNEEASIEVGQKIPFRRGTSYPSVVGSTGLSSSSLSQLTSSYNNLFSSVDRIDVSLKLTLTPQINERNKVRLETDLQIEDVVGKDESTQTPITANRSAKTVVVVDDQQTVVLGGLMRDRTTDSESKIPILGDLPIIGWLFKQRSSNVEKVNLLLVLTPYIIHDASDFQRIFERKLNEYEEFAAEYYGHRREYRAHIDYARKSGPLARLASTISTERAKLENGGGGDGAQTLVKPDPLPEEEGIPVPRDGEIHPEDLEEGRGLPEDPEPGLEVPDGDDTGMRATDDGEMPESPAVEPHPDMPPPGEEE